MEEVYQTARELGIDEERTYETYQEMAEKEAEREDCIDFVSITVPNHIHFDVAKVFLEKGINVVCDKPLCFTEEQSKILMNLANKNNVDLWSHILIPVTLWSGKRKNWLNPESLEK